MRWYRQATPYWFQLSLLAVSYFIAAKFSLLLSIPPGNATAVWPPSGIASAALLLCGMRLWPGVWLGATLGNLFNTGASVGTAALIGTGNTFETLILVFLIRRYIDLQYRFQSAKDVFKFAAFAALSSMMAATIGTASLAWGAYLGKAGFSANWWTWWLGDSTGIAIIVPLILSWAEPLQFESRPRKKYETWLFFGLLLAVGVVIFEDWAQRDIRRVLLYLIIPFIAWAGYRLSQRAMTTSILLICGLAIWDTVDGSRVFSVAQSDISLILLQTFMSTVALMGLVLCAVTGQRERVTRALEQSHNDLELRVNQRTLELRGANQALQADVTERKRVEGALRESTERLALAVKTSDIGLWDRDLCTNQFYFSPESKRQIGYTDEEISNRFDEWESRVHPDDLPAVLARVQAYMETPSETGFESEYRLRHKNGSYRWIYARAQLFSDASGQPARMLGCHVDITERKRAEAALRESEEQYRRIVELSPDAVTIHQDERCVFANSAGARILGAEEPSQLIGRSILDFIPPDVHEQVKAHWKQLFEDRESVAPVELKMLKPDGSIQYLEEHAARIVWGGRPAALVVARNVTERKHTDEALRDHVKRMQGLSRRLTEVEETERRRITRELHDRIGQSLSALSLSLNIIRSQLSGDSVRARLDAAQKLLETTTAHVRNVMADLHPPALEDYGLLAALRTHAESLRTSGKINVAVSGEDLVPRLAPVAEMALFRIAQSALANAARHAHARRIKVTLAAIRERVTLTISDDGTGFDIGRVGAAPASWGLTIMRERAEAIGARLRIDSEPGRGTRVVVEADRESA